MLNDLELVYLSHVANLWRWKINDPFIFKHSHLLGYNCEHLPKTCEQLLFFVNLLAYFVKKYVGSI